MNRTSPLTSALIALVSFALLWAGLSYLAEQHGIIVPVHWLSALGIAIITAVVLWQGRGVKRLKEGKTTDTTALGAFRTLALARSCIYGGAGLTGYFGAQMAVAGQTWHATFAAEHLWGALICALASVAAVVVGYIVEEWCRIPPDDDNQEGVSRREEGLGPA